MSKLLIYKYLIIIKFKDGVTMRLVENVLSDALKIKHNFMDKEDDIPTSIGIFPSCAYIMED